LGDAPIKEDHHPKKIKLDLGVCPLINMKLPLYKYATKLKIETFGKYQDCTTNKNHHLIWFYIYLICKVKGKDKYFIIYSIDFMQV
jgi:hypothetical protein